MERPADQLMTSENGRSLTAGFDSIFNENLQSSAFEKYNRLLKETQEDSFEQSADTPAHISEALQQKLIYLLNRIDGHTLSGKDCQACSKFIENGPEKLTPAESISTGKFLNYILDPRKASSLGISWETQKHLEHLENRLPNFETFLEKDIILQNTTFENDLNMSDTELKFRRQSYLINPDSKQLNTYIDTMLNDNRLSLKGPLSQIATTLATFVKDNFEYVPDNEVDTWSGVDETLSSLSGDCEDLHILLASMLMNVLKRKGYSDHKARQMVKVQAGYIDTPNGGIAGHTITKFYPESSKPVMALDPTSTTVAVYYDTYTFDAIFEFNDRIWNKFQEIDSTFETAFYIKDLGTFTGSGNTPPKDSILGLFNEINHTVNNIEMGIEYLDFDLYKDWFDDPNREDLTPTEVTGMRLVQSNTLDKEADETNEEFYKRQRKLITKDGKDEAARLAKDFIPSVKISWTQERAWDSDTNIYKAWSDDQIKYNQFWTAIPHNISLGGENVPPQDPPGGATAQSQIEQDAENAEGATSPSVGGVSINIPDPILLGTSDLDSVVIYANGGGWDTQEDREAIYAMLVANGYLEVVSATEWKVTGDFNAYAAKVEASEASPLYFDPDGEGDFIATDNPDRLEGTSVDEGNEFYDEYSEQKFERNVYDDEVNYYADLNTTTSGTDYGANQDFRKLIFKLLEDNKTEASISGTGDTIPTTPTPEVEAPTAAESSETADFKPYTGSSVDFVFYQIEPYKYFKFIEDAKNLLNKFTLYYHMANTLVDTYSQIGADILDSAL
ncbi:transglutaminase domain-containing protein, partial [bacterium]|nr:transglutaminase domain-containing protein [bacterium]